MTTAVLAPAPKPLQVTQLRVLASEWTKFRSVRSTLWTLLTAVVLMIGIGALIAAVTASQYHTFSAGERATFNAIGTSLSGINFAQLAVGVLGVLSITGEYSTGMIRSSLTAVPRRLPVLWGKLAVLSAVVFSVSLATAFGAFFLGQSLLSGQNLNVSSGAPGALRSIIGGAVYLTMAAAIGVAVGALLRNTAAGISLFVSAFFVLPPLTGLLPASVSTHLTQYLPSNAGASMYDGTARITSALSPGAGFGLLCIYSALLVAAAAWRLRRSDA
jgi:hypothetical protein